MKGLIVLVGFLSSVVGFADYKLAKSKNAVLCYGEDSMSWELNKNRTTIKFTVEGESSGAKKITKTVDQPGKSSVAYTTSDGTLTLGKQKDTYQFADQSERFEVECELK